MGNYRLRWSSLVFCFALAGCASSTHIADQSTKGNIGVEDAHNQILLLNTLRAYMRRPMYFTSISQLAGPLGTATPTATFGFPLNAAVAANNTLSTAFTADSNKFTVLVLDGQKFMQGFTTPVKPSLIKYFIDQGWPKELILSLFVREITFDPPVTLDDGRVVDSVMNYPGNPIRYDEFQKQIDGLIGCDFEFEEEDAEPKKIGPPLNLSDVQKLKELVEATKEKLSVIDDKKGHWNLVKKSEAKLGIALNKPNDVACKFVGTQPIPPEPVADGKPPAGTSTSSTQTAPSILVLAAKSARKKPVPDGTTPKREVGIFVRSPEAIIYYLGEIVRACLQPDGTHRSGCGETTIYRHKERIFGVARGKAHTSFVSVEYDGHPYSITVGPHDRSSHTLSLVSQLISLQKEASELPQTLPLRVITQ